MKLGLPVFLLPGRPVLLFVWLLVDVIVVNMDKCFIRLEADSMLVHPLLMVKCCLVCVSYKTHCVPTICTIMARNG